uniref:U3 small nucleolar RNA-associated protein 13 C-terminal domain-containing protein n=1 Tax=Ditylenchus dipsaci TaxID=166011 RepID=A0A915D3U4_9BILA
MEYVTAGTDGTMIVWQDVSKEAQEDLMKESREYSDALLLTLDLAQPYQCLTILLSFQFVGLCLSVEYEYEAAAISQAVLNHALRNIRPDEFLKLPNSESLVKAFLPYSNRHYERLSNLRTSVSFLDYVFSRMRLDKKRVFLIADCLTRVLIEAVTDVRKKASLSRRCRCGDA